MLLHWYNSSHWGTFWGQFEIELLGGIIGAFIFLFLVLIFFKPKVRIAKFICHVIPQEAESYYAFKFVNVSFFAAHDIRVTLYKARKIPMGNGFHNNTFGRISIVNNEIPFIPRRTPFWNKRDHNPHCIIIRSLEDINTILNDEMNAVVLQISLKHGLTGLSKVFEMDYSNGDIKKGKFTPGTKFGYK